MIKPRTRERPHDGSACFTPMFVSISDLLSRTRNEKKINYPQAIDYSMPHGHNITRTTGQVSVAVRQRYLIDDFGEVGGVLLSVAGGESIKDTGTDERESQDEE